MNRKLTEDRKVPSVMNPRVYLELYTDLVRDVAEQCSVSHKESSRDIEEIRRRFSHEGLPFLTVQLPRLGKCIDKALGQGLPLDVPFLDKRDGSVIPKLFGELLELVFDSSGLEKPMSSSYAVRALRQLVYFVYKLEIPHTLDQERKLLEEFVSIDQELGKPKRKSGETPDPLVLPTVEHSGASYPDVGWPYPQHLDLSAREALMHARCLAASVFGMFDERDIKPRHGPGAVATGETNATKHVFKRLYTDIEEIYPFTEYFVYNLSHVADRPEYLQSLTLLKSGTAKVVLVPKDSRGPRIISCEPLEYQWIQQGLGGAIQAWLEKHKLTRGQVNFTDQGVNRRLALSSSVDQQWYTLDMKEASDRVSTELVGLIFPWVPNLLAALMATRSTATRLPNGNVVQLNKFAPMGSCLCFPVESFVFYALAVGAIVADSLNKRPIRAKISRHAKVYDSRVREACKRVFVYGDDIILRPEDYGLVMQLFPQVGLLFNQDKCCTAGFFRESCGMDAHRGVNVTPLRLKKLWCHRRVDPVAITSYVALSNAAYHCGYLRTAHRIVGMVEQLTGSLPVLPPLNTPVDSLDPHYLYTVSYGGWVWERIGSSARVQPQGVSSRWNTRLHRFEVRTRQAAPLYKRGEADDWCMVLRRFTSPSELNEPGVYALTHRTKCQWVWIPAPR